jgi:hypothetical protein
MPWNAGQAGVDVSRVGVDDGAVAMREPSSTRRHKGTGDGRHVQGLVSAWGEADAEADRYHERAAPASPA